MRSRITAIVSAAACLAVAAAPALAQPLRGRVESRSFTGPITHTPVNFNIYLPENYDTSAARYPVVYHLHGIGGNQGGNQNTVVPRAFETAQSQGLIGPVIVVFPNGYVNSWWADSATTPKPADTDVASQLIPYVDANFRTIADPGSRVIEGFSMGGFGATKFYSKYPGLFACCVEYDGAIVTWSTMLQFHASDAAEIFNNSEAYYNQFSPWYWCGQNAATLRTKPPVRMVVGALVGGNQQFRNFLTGLSIPVDYTETGCAHDIGCLMTAQGVQSAAFIASHLVPPCDPDFNGDGNSDQDDVAYLINILAGSPNPAGADPDFNHDGNADQDDVSALVNVVSGGACP